MEDHRTRFCSSGGEAVKASRFACHLVFAILLPCAALAQTSYSEVIAQTQPKIVKVFGAGGLRGLEAYQSGFLISGDGHILTAWSYVLDADVVTVYLNDGRKLPAEVLGMDPRSEIAVLKIDSQDLSHFKLEEA